MPPTQGHERSGCETPVSVDSIPLEWDHTGDVGGSSSHEDEEEATYYSALSGENLWVAASLETDNCRMSVYGKGGGSRSYFHIVCWFSGSVNRCKQSHLLSVLMEGTVLSKPSLYCNISVKKPLFLKMSDGSSANNFLFYCFSCPLLFQLFLIAGKYCIVRKMTLFFFQM